MNANRTQILLLGAFGLIILSLVNIFIKTIPLAFAHAVYFCQKTLANVIIFPHSTPFIILFSLSFIFLIGLIVLMVQFLKTQLFIRRTLTKSTLSSKKLQAIAKTLDLENKIDVINNKHYISFCYGLFRPRICLSSGLITSLNSYELKTVLFHESYHLKNHDPLRILLGKTASLMLFFIPTLKDIQSHYAFSKEIAADEVVIRNGDKHSLISALTKLLSPTVPSLSGVAPYRMVQGVAAFADSHSLENRILYLTEQKKVSIRLSKQNLLLSFFGVLLLFTVLSLPVHAIAVSDKDKDHSYFICPFGSDCINSCEKEFETVSSKNFSEEVPYTPVK